MVTKNHKLEKNIWLQIPTLPASDNFIVFQ